MSLTSKNKQTRKNKQLEAHEVSTQCYDSASLNTECGFFAVPGDKPPLHNSGHNTPNHINFDNLIEYNADTMDENAKLDSPLVFSISMQRRNDKIEKFSTTKLETVLTSQYGIESSPFNGTDEKEQTPINVGCPHFYEPSNSSNFYKNLEDVSLCKCKSTMDSPKLCNTTRNPEIKEKHARPTLKVPIYSEALLNIPKSIKTNPLTSQQMHDKFSFEKCTFTDALERYDAMRKRLSYLYPNCSGLKLLNKMKIENITLKNKLKQTNELLIMKNEEVIQLRKQLLYTVELAFH